MLRIAESFEHRERQRLLVDRRHEATAQAPPESARPERLGPPPPPPNEGPPTDSEDGLELCHPLPRRTVLHRGHKDHHRAAVHLRPEKSHRWWCRSASAAVHRAAEAQPPGVFIAELAGNAARLAPVVRGIESASAFAPRSPHPGGEILVALQQQRVKPGVLDELVAQGRPSFSFTGERRGSPRALEWSSFPRASAMAHREPCSESQCSALSYCARAHIRTLGATQVARLIASELPEPSDAMKPTKIGSSKLPRLAPHLPSVPRSQRAWRTSRDGWGSEYVADVFPFVHPRSGVEAFVTSDKSTVRVRVPVSSNGKELVRDALAALAEDRADPGEQAEFGDYAIGSISRPDSIEPALEVLRNAGFLEDQR